MSIPHDLVIGGTRGLGRALVQLWDEQGHVVSVIGHRPPSEPDRNRTNVRYWTVDVTDRGALSCALDELLERHGPLNAAACFQRYREGEDDWSGEFATSLTATRQVIERTAEAFDKQGAHAIVIISSVASWLIADEQPLSYHVAKAALNQLVRWYAVTLGRRGIRVNGVSPGTVVKEESKSFYLEQEELQALYRRVIPLGRMGTAEEIAQVAAFLCSSHASFLTGQNLVVDGGLSLQWQETVARKFAALEQAPIARPSPARSR